MLRIDVTTLISRPVQEVWDYFIDLRNSPRWTRSGSELRPTSEGAFGVGTTVESVRTVLGREIKSQSLVTTHYDPGHSISFTADVALLGRLAASHSRVLEVGPGFHAGPNWKAAAPERRSEGFSRPSCGGRSRPNWPT